MSHLARLLSAVAAVLAAGPASAADLPPFEKVFQGFTATFDPPTARPGQVVVLKLKIAVDPAWHTYPTKAGQPDPKSVRQTNAFILPKSADLMFLGEPINPPGFQLADPANLAGAKERREYHGGATWEQRLVVSRDAKPGTLSAEVKAKILICQDACFPPRTVAAKADLVVAGDPVEIAPSVLLELGMAPPPTPAAPPTPAEEGPGSVGLKIPAGSDFAADLKAVADQLTQDGADRAGSGDGGFASFLVTAMFWGAVTLLTPCVFPMIPITVSFFLKQGEKKGRTPSGWRPFTR